MEGSFPCSKEGQQHTDTKKCLERRKPSPMPGLCAMRSQAPQNVARCAGQNSSEYMYHSWALGAHRHGTAPHTLRVSHLITCHTAMLGPCLQPNLSTKPHSQCMNVASLQHPAWLDVSMCMKQQCLKMHSQHNGMHPKPSSSAAPLSSLTIARVYPFIGGLGWAQREVLLLLLAPLQRCAGAIAMLKPQSAEVQRQSRLLPFVSQQCIERKWAGTESVEFPMVQATFHCRTSRSHICRHPHSRSKHTCLLGGARLDIAARKESEEAIRTSQHQAWHGVLVELDELCDVWCMLSN
jgi:hypothetical protein